MPLQPGVQPNREAQMARMKLSQARTEAVKKMAAEGVVAILTPSRDGQSALRCGQAKSKASMDRRVMPSSLSARSPSQLQRA